MAVQSYHEGRRANVKSEMNFEWRNHVWNG
jgi:hypothetical protein